MLPVDVRGLRFEVGGRRLLKGVDLSVAAGESVAVMGPSGSGKSTLLSLITGLIRPAPGEVVVLGQDMAKLRGRALAAFRRERVGMVFQFGELLPELEAVENVALAALIGGVSRSKAYARAQELLELVGVVQRDGVVTADLSGGERQRVAVARALIGSPALLLADEPTGSLDDVSRARIADLLFAVPRQHDCALVVVTHDPAVARRADRVLHLYDGFLTEGTADLWGIR